MTSKKSSAAQSSTNSAGEFEKTLETGAKPLRYVLRLYVTGNSPRSVRAITNIRGLCEKYLPGNYDLEVVDIYQQPAQAVEEQIIAAPTLIKEQPMPVRRLVGDLSDWSRILSALSLFEKVEIVGSPST